MLNTIPHLDELRGLPPEAVATRLIEYRDKRLITPGSAKVYANRLFKDGDLDGDGHGLVMGKLQERRMCRPPQTRCQWPCSS